MLSQEVLRRAGAAPQPRALLDVVLDTAARHPTAPALDDGTIVLTYAELVADVEQRAGALAGRGGATRRPGRRPTAVGVGRALRQHPGRAARGSWLGSPPIRLRRPAATADESRTFAPPRGLELGEGATVNRGCVLQTHLFHDRVLSTERVVRGAGATLGPHGVVLPAAVVGARSTVGPASLVVRGDRLPESTRWLGNPVAPWHAA